MRKRTILILIDKLLWLFILLLPVIAYFLAPIGYALVDGTGSLPTFADYISQFGINVDNVVYSALVDMSGTDGIIHMFNDNSSLLMYFTYFVSVELVHLFIDFIVFIPRLAHKWMSCLTREGDE